MRVKEPEASKNAPPKAPPAKAPPVQRQGPPEELEPSGPLQAMNDDLDAYHPPMQPSFTGNDDMDDMIKKCLVILKVKGNDYTLGKNEIDRLHNFRTAAEFVGITPAQALGVYFYKHIAAVFNFIRGDHSESEPIEGRIADSINYMLLFTVMVRELQKGKT